MPHMVWCGLYRKPVSTKFLISLDLNIMARMREPWLLALATTVISRDWSEASEEEISAPVRHSAISNSLWDTKQPMEKTLEFENLRI